MFRCIISRASCPLNLLLIAALLVVQGAPIAASEVPTPKVGVIIPLSGPMAEWGRSIQLGIEFAREKLDSRVEFIFEDEAACDAARALTAAQKLLHVDKVDLLMAGCLNGLKSSLPVARKAGALIVSLGLVDDDLVTRGDRFLLTPSASIEAEAQAISRLLKEDGRKRLAVLRVEDNFTEEIVDGLQRHAQGDGWELDSDERVTFGTTEFRSLLAKLATRKIDSLLMYMSTEQVVAATRQLKEQRISSLALYAGYVIEADPPPQQELSVLDGVRYAAAVTPVDDELSAYLISKESKETFQTRVAADAVTDVARAFSICAETQRTTKCLYDAITTRRVTDAAFSGGFRYDSNGLAERTIRGKVVRDGRYEWAVEGDDAH